MESMRLEYTPIARDYSRAMWTFIFSERRNIWYIFPLLVFIAVSPIGIAVVYILAGDTVPVLPFLLTVFALAIFAYAYIIQPFITERRAKKNNRMLSPVAWELDQNNLKFKTAFAESQMDWGTFGKVIESRQYFLLIYSFNKRMFTFLPKRAFTLPEQEGAFRALLKGYIREYRDATTGVPSWLPALIVGLLYLLALGGYVTYYFILVAIVR
jgi:hypothetical protein